MDLTTQPHFDHIIKKNLSVKHRKHRVLREVDVFAKNQ